MNDQDTTAERLTAELVELRQRLFTLMSNLPGMAYRCRNDRQWSMEFVSEGCFSLTGYQAAELMNNRTIAYGDIIHPDDRGAVYDQVQRALAERCRFQLEYRIRMAQGAERWAWEQGVGVFSGNGELQFLEGFITDITQRKQAEEAIKNAHDELEEEVKRRTAELAIFHKFAESSSQGFGMADLDGRIAYVNPTMCRFMGEADPREVIGRFMWSYYDEGVKERRNKEVLPALERDGFWDGELPMLSRHGTLASPLHHIFLLRDAEERPLLRCVIVTDITERKQAEEALERERQSLWRMLQASDHERRIISYEIHDGLAQYLAAAGMQFQRYDALRGDSPDKAATAYQTAVELVRQAYTEARRLISQVRPPIIDEVGLESAIADLVHEQQRCGGPKGPKIHFDSKVQFGRLALILENALYRIAQEALTNACKHSRSKEVTVRLRQQGQEVCLTVQDWGIGFDPKSVEKGHFGLEGVRQRVRLLGGRLTIESTPGAGTKVEVAVPILEQ